MRKLSLLLSGVFILNLCLALPTFAEEATLVASPDEPSLDASEDLDEELDADLESDDVDTSATAKTPEDYFAEIDKESGIVDTAISPDNSFFAAGSDVTLRGDISGIAFAAGNKVDLLGSAEYGLLAGNSVRVSGLVSGDLFAAGQSVTLTEDADIYRDVFLAGQTVTISTNLYGNVFIAAERLVLEGVTIDGNLHAGVSEIVVKEKSAVSGTFYRPADLSVSGGENFSAGSTETSPILSGASSSAPGSAFTGKLISLCGRIVLSVILIALCLKLASALTTPQKADSLVKGLGFGLLLVLGLPLCAAFFMITLIGLPLGLALLLVWLAFSYLGVSVTSLVLGEKLWTLIEPRVSNKPMKFKSPATSLTLRYLLGAVTIFILGFIPVLGGLLSATALVYGFGHLTMTLFSMRKATLKQ